MICSYCKQDTIKTADKRYSLPICHICMLKHHAYLKQLRQYNLSYRNKENVMKVLKKNWDMNVPLRDDIHMFNKDLIERLGVFDYIKSYINERQKELK